MNRRRQPQRTPPPVTSGSEALEADLVLQELEGSVALCLWRTVRTVRLWAELPADERSAAFNPSAYADRLAQIAELDVPSHFRETLGSAAEVLRGGATRAATVGDACVRIAGWAEARGAIGTALEFAQAAALVLPRQAELTLEVARLAEERGEIARAESWFRQAVFTARQTRDWPSFANAFMGLGKMHVRRGDRGPARIAFLRALRISRRHSQGLIAANACHHIVEVAILSRRSAEVARYGAAALQGYRDDAARVVALSRTLAAYLVDRDYFADARRLMEAIPRDDESRADRFGRAVTLAQCGAALGVPDLYGASMAEVASLLEENPAVEAPAAGWTGLLRASAWMADAEGAVLIEPHARRAAGAVADEELLREITWLADAGAEPPDLRIRQPAAPLAELVDELMAALETSPGAS